MTVAELIVVLKKVDPKLNVYFDNSYEDYLDGEPVTIITRNNDALLITSDKIDEPKNYTSDQWTPIVNIVWRASK